jgi:hypothetical protein
MWRNSSRTSINTSSRASLFNVGSISLGSWSDRNVRMDSSRSVNAWTSVPASSGPYWLTREHSASRPRRSSSNPEFWNIALFVISAPTITDGWRPPSFVPCQSTMHQGCDLRPSHLRSFVASPPSRCLERLEPHRISAFRCGEITGSWINNCRLPPLLRRDGHPDR